MNPPSALGSAPEDRASLESLAKLMLDISSYADHDEDCVSNGSGECSCGYTETSRRVLEQAERVSAAGNPGPPQLGRFCPACQAIPQAGYCRLPDCPMPQPGSQSGAAGAVGPATWCPLDDNGLAELRINGRRILSLPSYGGAQKAADRINAALSTTPQPRPAEGDADYDSQMGRDPSPPRYDQMQAGDMLKALGDDGAKWADAFCQINPGADWGLMLGWFCNAIEHSNDVRRWRREASTLRPAEEAVREAVERLERDLSECRVPRFDDIRTVLAALKEG